MSNENKESDINKKQKSKLDLSKEELDIKFNRILALKEEMERQSREKRNLLNGKDGTTVLEEKVKDLEKRKNRATQQERDDLSITIYEYNSKIEENKYLIKNIQGELNETSNKVLELSKEIFALSTDIILELLKDYKEGKDVFMPIDAIEIYYYERAVSRMKRICKLYPEEIEKLDAIDFRKVPTNLLKEVREYFEIQKQALEIVCSPIIEVVPESQRIVEQ